MGNLRTEEQNRAKVLIAGEAVYSTHIEGASAALLRGDAIQALDAFYSSVCGAESGVFIRRMEVRAMSERARTWEKNLARIAVLTDEHVPAGPTTREPSGQ